MRLTIAALLLVAGCASTSTSAHFLYIDSAYCCGAAEGLGCGLAIAPVLEQIDQIEGVKESATSWDGRRFRIELNIGADRDRVLDATHGILESNGTCAMAPSGAVSPIHKGEWFNAQQTVQLSRYEAGVIAAKFAEKVASDVPLKPDVAERLHVIIREELERAFELAHAAGGGVDRLREQFPVIMPEFQRRIAELMTSDESQRVVALLACGGAG